MRSNEFLREGANTTDLFAGLEALGCEDITDSYARKGGYERKFKVPNLDANPIARVMTTNGFRMVTQTTSGHPLEPNIVFKDDTFKGGTAQLHYREGKVFYIVFNFRSSND